MRTSTTAPISDTLKAKVLLVHVLDHGSVGQADGPLINNGLTHG